MSFRFKRCIWASVIGVLLGAVSWGGLFFFSPRLNRSVSVSPSVQDFLASSFLPWRIIGDVHVTSPAPRVVFVGDVMLDRNVATRTNLANDPLYPFRKLPPRWMDGFDYAVGNLEGPVTDKRRPPEKTIDFLFRPDVLLPLHSVGFDAFSQANNHSLDQGRVGFEDSRARLSSSGFLVFGDQVRDDEIAVATTTIRGSAFAFVGFNITDNPLDVSSAERILAEIRPAVEYIVVFLHWGVEYHDSPEPSQVDLAHWLIDHGVDAVIGGHPHWVQGLSSYRGKPIVYSLGNFVFDQDFSDETRQGLAVALTFQRDRFMLEPLPIQIDRSQPHVLAGDERQARLDALALISDEELRSQIRSGTVFFYAHP